MNLLDNDTDVEIGNRRRTAADPHKLLTPAERQRANALRKAQMVVVTTPVGSLASA